MASHTVTRNWQTARQIHLHRGCYPFYYDQPRPQSDADWQLDIDTRIRYGIEHALELGILKPGATVIAVQGASPSSRTIHSCVEAMRAQAGAPVAPTPTLCASSPSPAKMTPTRTPSDRAEP
jgi:hypothetical protein